MLILKASLRFGEFCWIILGGHRPRAEEKASFLWRSVEPRIHDRFAFARCKAEYGIPSSFVSENDGTIDHPLDGVGEAVGGYLGPFAAVSHA